jgi:hypothetical protein
MPVKFIERAQLNFTDVKVEENFLRYESIIVSRTIFVQASYETLTNMRLSYAARICFT